MFAWILTLLGLLGAYLNAVGKKEGFILWIIMDAGYVWHSYQIDQPSQMVLFASYLFLASYGLYKWGR